MVRKGEVVDPVLASIITGIITGCCSLAGVLVSSSKTEAVLEEKVAELRRSVDKLQSDTERLTRLETSVAVIENDIETLYRKVG